MGGAHMPPILSIKPQQALCKNPIRRLAEKYQEQTSAATQKICNKGSRPDRCRAEQKRGSALRLGSASATSAFSYRDCSEGPVSALHVEMCMVQHLSLRGVFCVHCDWHQCPHQLNSSSHPQKKSVAIPPPGYPRREAGRGLGLCMFYA